MHPLKYYIGGSNARKQGYDHGCVNHGRFLVETSDPKGKNGAAFINDYLKELIKEDKNRIDESMKILQDEIDVNKAKIKKIEDKKNDELRELKEKYDRDSEDLRLEKVEIEIKFKKISSDIVGNMTQANTIINGLVEKLKKYASDSAEYRDNQSKKIGEEWKKFSVNSKKLVTGNIKDLLLNGIDTEVLEPDNRTYRKDFGAMLFLLLICIYDFSFGFDAISNRVTLPIWLVCFLALGFVPLVIWSVHYACITLNGKATNQKTLGILTIVFICIIVALYVGQSLPGSVRQSLPLPVWIIKLLGDSGLITIFRLFMLPSMFIGEIIIETTNRDNIAHYFNKIGKKFGIATHLVRNGLATLKMRSISRRLKEEKKSIAENVDNIRAELTPDILPLMQDANKIKELINPIYDNQAGSKDVYERNLEKVNRRIQILKEEYDRSLTKINNKFDEDTSEMKMIIDNNEREKEKYKRDFSEWENEIRSGFLRGLRA